MTELLAFMGDHGFLAILMIVVGGWTAVCTLALVAQTLQVLFKSIAQSLTGWCDGCQHHDVEEDEDD